MNLELTLTRRAKLWRQPLGSFCKVASGADRMYAAQIIRASNPERPDVNKLEHTVFAANAADIALSHLDVTPCLHGKKASSAFHLARDHLFEHLHTIRNMRLSFVGIVHTMMIELVLPLRHLRSVRRLHVFHILAFPRAYTQSSDVRNAPHVDFDWVVTADQVRT